MKMKIGDLVREKGLQERTGVIVGEVNERDYSDHPRLFKVLWSELSPTLPTLVGPAWPSELEVISESR
tara:strand:+ start:293 stop:496 length:204 start_codon:yes stop_codon:yes gene_type:complete